MDARNFFDVRVEGAPSPNSYTVPDRLTRTGDFSQSGKIIVYPITLVPLPNDIIPASRLDPIARGLEAFIPLTNADATSSTPGPPPTGTITNGSVKSTTCSALIIISPDVISGTQTPTSATWASLPGFYASNR